MNIHSKVITLLLLLLFVVNDVFAQKRSDVKGQNRTEDDKNNSQLLYNTPIEDITITHFIVVEGDTIPIVQLSEIPITSDKIRSKEEEREYRKLKYNTIKVYPYAKRALWLLDQLEETTANMNKRRDAKRYKKALEKELKATFTDELKKLTTSQGKILVKLIERGTEQTFYQILREQKNIFTAFFYHNAGKSYGYDLKEGYDAERYDDLETIVSFLEQHGVQYFGYKDYPLSENLSSFQLPQTSGKSKKKN